MVQQSFLPNFEEAAPGAAYLRGLQNRLGFNPQSNIYGRFQAQQQTPFQNTFAFQNLLNPAAAGGLGDNPFLAFTQANNLGGVRDQARGLFNQLGSAGTPSAIQQQFQQPDEGQASALRNLAVTALLSRISPLALGLLNVPSGGDLRDQFLSQTGGQPTNAAGTGPNDFISYVRNALGLGLI